MSGGKVDKRLGGIYRDKDDTGSGTGDPITVSSEDNSIEITLEGDNYDLSVRKAYLELFASNESELLNCWTIARASGKSCRIYIIGQITFTAIRNFLIDRGEPEISLVGYPHNVFQFGNFRVNWSRVTIENIDFRTTHDTYLYVKEGYINLKNVRYIDDVLYDESISNMKVHVRSYSPASYNTGNINIDGITHYTQTVAWNESGDVQPIIIINEGTLYHNLYVNIKNVDAVQSFDRFSRVLIDASVSTPYKVTGDVSWLYHWDQILPGDGYIHIDAEIYKNSSIDRCRAERIPVENDLNSNSILGIGYDGTSEIIKRFPIYVSRTFAEILTLVQDGNLVPGRIYELTDFQTKHVIAHTNVINTGAVEDLRIIAASQNKFFKVAFSSTFPKDYIEFDFEDILCEDGATARKGKITLRRDQYGNETPYDFRAVKFRRWSIDVVAWDNATTYQRARLTKHNNILYKFPHCELYAESTIGEDPLTDTRWTKYLDITTTRYLIPKEFVGAYNNPGGVLNTGVSHPASQDYYTFTDAAGTERSSWFRNCVIKAIDKQRDLIGDLVRDTPYNNIVFIETATGQSYNNYIDGQCYDLTFCEKTFNNKFSLAVRNCIFESSCFDNDLVGFWQNKVGTGFSQNTGVSRMIASSLFGINCTGNTFAGEGVYNTIKDGFSQNNTQQDFTGNLVEDGFHYNSCDSDMWDNHIRSTVVNNRFGPRFQANDVGSGLNLCTFQSGVNGCIFPTNAISITVFSDLFTGLDCTAADLTTILQATYSKRIYSASDGGGYLEFHTGTALRMLPIGFPANSQITEGYITDDGQHTYIRFKKEVSTIDSFFFLQLTATKATIGDSGVIQSDAHWVRFDNESDIIISDVTRIAYTYNNDDLTFTDSSILNSFTDFPVRNNSTVV